MGYYTHYKLSLINGSPELIRDLRNEKDWAKFALKDDGESDQECTWYSHEDDIKDFSKKHPEALFLLEMEGEDNLDVWKKYIKNGKCQTCKAIVSFDDFDESKLI